MERGILFGRIAEAWLLRATSSQNSLKSGLEIAQLVGIVSIPSPTIRNQLMTYITLKVRTDVARALQQRARPSAESEELLQTAASLGVRLEPYIPAPKIQF